LVDDPGYFILNGSLQALGATVIGVKWRQHGPDPQDLELLIIEHQPKLFFTNSILHNPSGTSINQSTAYRLLQIAEKYDIIIVEDDIYADFQASQKTRLASLDQLDRVIYLSGFSKTISASIRVGFIACKQALAVQLTDVKLLSGLTTSEANERFIHHILSNGYYRKHLDSLHRHLRQALQTTLQNFDRLGLRPEFESEGGMFIWVKMPEHIDIIDMATAAARQEIMLAPGHLFRPQQQHSQYMRFNIACCNDKKTLTFLQDYLA